MGTAMPREFTPRPQQRRIIEHDARRPLVVIAGAGSGKTATLVERIRWLVCNHHVDPRRILAVTFSRSAAAELSARLAARLGSRAEDVKVSTFHAFCREMLLQHAYRAEVDPDLRVLEESEALTRFAGVYAELLDGRLDVDVPRTFDLVAAGKTMARLYRLVTTVTEEGLDASALRTAVARAHAAIMPANGEPEALEIDGDLAEGRYRIGPRKGDLKPSEALQRRHSAPSRATLERQLAEEAATANVVAAVMERFDAMLAERGEATYAHLVAHLNRLLDDEEHRAAIRGCFTHCVVDEYQDTNAAQQRLLERIFGERLHGVMLVGDPRQSIYGFRNARPEEIERLAAAYGSAGIDENFRSFQRILDAAHHAIVEQRPDDVPMRAQREAPPGFSDEVTVIVSRAQSRANGEARAREAETIANETAELISSCGLRYADIAILVRQKTNAHVYVEALARLGIPARTTGGVGFYETAEVEEALAWLRFADDPSDDAALLRVLSTGIIGLNETAIAAFAASNSEEPDAAERRLRFARAVLLDPPPTMLGDDTRERVETLRTIADELDNVSALPLADAVQRVLRASGVEHRYALNAQHSLDGRQAVANLRRLIEIAQSFAHDLPDARIPDFLRYLEGLHDVEFDEREADPPAADAVTIATIHWAKGREWPVVFVADATPGVFPATRTPELVVWDYDERTLIVTRDEDGAPTYHALRARFPAGRSAGNDAWKARELAEERRLFYVALTRARDRVYVCGTVPVTTKGERPSTFLEEIRRLDGVRALDAVPEDAPLPVGAPAALDEAARDDADLADLIRAQQARDEAERLAREAAPSSADVRVLSFTALDTYATCPLRYRYAYVLALPGLAQPDLPLLDGYDVGATEYGTLIHVALERYNRRRAAGQRIDLHAALEQAIDELALRERLSPDRLAAARASLDAYREHPLASAHVLAAEERFTVEIGGVTVTGAIDLVAELDGRSLIVDYKTGGGEIDHYGLQLAIYREAANRIFGERPWETLLAIIRDGTVHELHVPEPDAGARVREIADRILRGEHPARPGSACATCPYRDEPCNAWRTQVPLRDEC